MLISLGVKENIHVRVGRATVLRIVKSMAPDKGRGILILCSVVNFKIWEGNVLISTVRDLMQTNLNREGLQEKHALAVRTW
jgi:hypothetical protein